jgi:hypothetical protein
VIVVVGNPAWRDAAPGAPAGRACEVALEAARRGSRVELVGRCGDDAAGDALLIALAAAGVSHAAMLRDPSRPTPVVAPASADDDALSLDELTLASDPGDRAADARQDVLAADASMRPRLDAADVALALEYLTAFEVLVVTDDVPVEILPVAVEAAAFASAHLVLLVPDGRIVPDALPAAATALAAPDGADEGAFAALVGAYAAGLDGGATPAAAFAGATGDAGWEALDPAR